MNIGRISIPPNDWKQHFPTYHFNPKNRDIVLAEYETTSRTLEADERLFSNATNVTLLVLSAFGSLAVGSIEKLSNLLGKSLPAEAISISLIILVWAYAASSLSFFASKQKAMALAQRKIVVLRKMLGLDYGRLQLILPNKRLEGAAEPFNIKMFPGWISSQSYPYWILTIFSSALTFFLVAKFLSDYAANLNDVQSPLIVAVMWCLFLACIYRFSLFDTHETFLLLRIKLYAFFLRIRLLQDHEPVIYRAKLAWYETDRLSVETAQLERMLVFLEDRDFFNHKGISYKALVRAALGLLRIKRRSGGSTITQQLVRTLFIVDFSKKFRRKLIELVMACWFEKVSSKPDILKMYLSSVRYDKNIFGITEAMKYYFGKVIQNPSKAQAFFLIERVSNIRSKLLVSKVAHSLHQAKTTSLINEADFNELMAIYLKMVSDKKINIEDQKAFDRFKQLSFAAV